MQGVTGPWRHHNCQTWMILFKAYDLPFFLTNGKEFFLWTIIVTSLDQRCSVCHTSHSGGNSIAGWHVSVCPGREYDEVDVLKHMSLLESQWFLVCHQSQQRGLIAPLVFSLSMHSLEQDECLSDPNWLLEMEGCHLLWLQHECSKDTAPLAFHTRCFTNPTLLYTDLAHALVSTSEPPCLSYNEHTHKCENCSGMMFWSR